MNGAGAITGDGSISNIFQGNDQVCDLLASVFVDCISYKFSCCNSFFFLVFGIIVAEQFFIIQIEKNVLQSLFCMIEFAMTLHRS